MRLTLGQVMTWKCSVLDGERIFTVVKVERDDALVAFLWTNSPSNGWDGPGKMAWFTRNASLFHNATVVCP